MSAFFNFFWIPRSRQETGSRAWSKRSRGYKCSKDAQNEPKTERWLHCGAHALFGHGRPQNVTLRPNPLRRWYVERKAYASLFVFCMFSGVCGKSSYRLICRTHSFGCEPGVYSYRFFIYSLVTMPEIDKRFQYIRTSPKRKAPLDQRR